MFASPISRKLAGFVVAGCSMIWLSQGTAFAANTLTCPTAKLASIPITSVQLSGASLANGKVVTPPSKIVVSRAVTTTNDPLSLDGGRSLGTCTLTFERGKQPAGLGYLKLTVNDAFVFVVGLVQSASAQKTQSITLNFTQLAYANPAPVPTPDPR
jgi:hypothetical protein